MQNEKIAQLATDETNQSTRAFAAAASSGAERMREAVGNGAQQARAVMHAGAEQVGQVSGDMMKAAQTGGEQARRAMDASSAQTREAAESMVKATQAAAEFARANMEALSRATQTYTAGIQDLGRQSFALAQSLSAHTLEGARAMGSSKTPKEAADVYADYLRQNLEQLMGESARLQDAGFRLAEQAAAPITQRITEAAERLGQPTTN